MPRRRSQPQHYLQKKTGVFSRFSTPTSIVIECVLTSFDIQELKWLSYARELRLQHDFDLLIQRDIDERRAKDDISEYIVSDENTNKKPVFLPPLIAAVVPIDQNNAIKKYYPKSDCESGSDQDGKFYRRTWAPYFQVTHYEDKEDGLRLFVDNNSDEPVEGPLVSPQSVDIGITLTREPGAKLVVIDGQHRLFALNHLREHDRYSEAVKNLLIPVLIVYAPNSEEGATREVPYVPEVFRQLFVDVNSEAHKVSGHFVILLSDNTLGSMICRSFCDQVLKEPNLSEMRLAQIEWNTRNDKESKTISKEYTLTSIGVIDDLLNSVFKQSKEQELLRYMLNLEHEEFVFGQDGAGNSKPEPKGFPWQGFSYEHKEKLREHVKDHFVPCLIEIFFHSKQYKAVKKTFDDAYSQIIDKEINERASAYQSAATMARNFLLHNFPLSVPESKALMQKFNQKFTEQSEGRYSEIIRNNVYQKGILKAWILVQRIGKRLNLKPIDTTKGFVILLDESLNNKLFVNDDKHLYLQDSVYDNFRIKPTLACRLQICRLTLALLGKANIRNKVIAKIQEYDNCNAEDLSARLETLGVDSVVQFLGDLKKERTNKFIRSFRSDLHLTDSQRENLIKSFDEKKDAKKRKIHDSNVQIPDEFDRLVEKLIKEDFEMAQTQLGGITKIYADGESEIEDIEED